MKVISRGLRGPVLSKWNTLIASGAIRTDANQLRAVGIVDSYFESLFRDHKSESGEKAKLSAFDMSLFRTSGETDNDHANVAEYTRRLARENMRMYRAQRRTPHAVAAQPVERKFENSETSSVVESDVIEAPTAPHMLGLYLFGSVGRGKTMLMNLLAQSLKPERVCRIHFFDFMKSVHNRMSAGRTVEQVANDLADDLDVILLDEVAISDVQDCAIFPAVMQILLKRKVGFVMTSNQHPQSLYLNGLNRHIFLPPLLRLIRAHGRLVKVDDPESESQIDFRIFSSSDRGWVWTNEFSDLTDFKPISVPLSPTRSLGLKGDGNHVVARAEEILNCELSESDFVKLAEFLNAKNIRLKLQIREPFAAVDILGPARRFGKLIEVLYDQNCLLSVESKVSREELFRNISKAELDRTGAVGDSSEALASTLANSAVDEALRAVSRCVSRLSEARYF